MLVIAQLIQPRSCSPRYMLLIYRYCAFHFRSRRKRKKTERESMALSGEAAGGGKGGDADRNGPVFGTNHTPRVAVSQVRCRAVLATRAHPN